MDHRQQNKWYPKDVYRPISKLHSILAVANLLAHNNISEICYCGQISLQSAAINCSVSNNLTPLGVPFILLAMEHIHVYVLSVAIVFKINLCLLQNQIQFSNDLKCVC